MRRLLLHPLYPRIFQIIAAVLLAVSLYSLFTGPSNDEYNLGSYLIWYLWWAALPLTFLLLGRMWCAVCPIGLFSDGLQKIAPWTVRWPAVMRHFELPLLAAALAATHFFNLWFNFEENMAAGRTFVVLLIFLSLTTALVFRRRVWCRSLCPVGALGSLMSRFSTLRLQSSPDRCSDCSGIPCREICPSLEEPRDGIDMSFCTFCGECLKACPHESCSVARQGGTTESRATPFPRQVSVAALVLVGIALDMALKHLTDWPIIFWKMTSSLEMAPTAGLEMLVHGAVVSVPFLLAGMAAAGSRPSFGRRLEGISRSLLPLGVMAVAALALRPLLLIGPRNLGDILLSSGFRGFGWLGASRYLEGWPLTGMQWALMGIGFSLSWKILRENSREGTPPGPFLLFSAGAACAVVGALFLWIFAQPMVS